MEREAVAELAVRRFLHNVVDKVEISHDNPASERHSQQ